MQKFNWNNKIINFLAVFLSIVCSSCAVRSANIKPNVQNFAQVKVSVDLQLEVCEKKGKCELKSPGIRNALGSGTFFTYKNKKLTRRIL